MLSIAKLQMLSSFAHVKLVENPAMQIYLLMPATSLLVCAVPPCACAACQQQMKTGWYDKVFAWIMAHGDAYEEMIAPVKRQLFAQLPKGATVLDAGIGAGPNLKYLAQKVGCLLVILAPHKAHLISTCKPATTASYLEMAVAKVSNCGHDVHGVHGVHKNPNESKARRKGVLLTAQ